MSVQFYREDPEASQELKEQIIDYEPDWSDYDLDESITEDDDYLYLELETSDDIADEFLELGRLLKARSTGIVNEGERYVMSLEK